ncbi:hypothetical protein NLG97_g1763 [Lecanicillium saksenae]|uniref:Uncharacterized protein n=1 Tax=Lecanicillium saksenae TaxID=468837 RepID=A0ACC1R695_9HYPO|nr:hypothetical protein NLG97_g1763 [Lecanicillium saksenae]
MAECATFTITSGALCFGPLLDIYLASVIPVQDPPEPKPFRSGTVKMHKIDHNLPAKMGTWRAYPLAQPKPPNMVNAWFVAHEDVDPEPELTKLLRVAGCPYEYECGNRVNNEATREQGVLLVNRYDWVRQHTNETVALPDWLQPLVDSPLTLDQVRYDMENGNTIGIVDYDHAQETIQNWSSSPSRERQPSPHGVWLHIPEAEYMWARFGFDASYSRAESMLFFTIRTDFFDTALPGRNEALRIWETLYERYQRGVYEGQDFSGLDWLRENSTPQPEFQDPGVRYTEEPPPLQKDALGPYDKDLHILKMNDLEIVLASFHPREPFPELNINTDEDVQRWRDQNQKSVFSAPHQDAILDLINELVLSYLDNLLPILANADRTNSPALLFPRVPETRWKWPLEPISVHLLREFSTPSASPLDTGDICQGIGRFLDERSGGSLQLSSHFITGLANVVRFILRELLDFTDRTHAYGRAEMPPEISPIITPVSIRQAVWVDTDLMNTFRHSSVFWYGRV